MAFNVKAAGQALSSKTRKIIEAGSKPLPAGATSRSARHRKTPLNSTRSERHTVDKPQYSTRSERHNIGNPSYSSRSERHGKKLSPKRSERYARTSLSEVFGGLANKAVETPGNIGSASANRTVSSASKVAGKQTGGKKKSKATLKREEKKVAENRSLLLNMEHFDDDEKGKHLWETTKTLVGSAHGNLSNIENLKKAGKGTLQASAASTAAHGGLAALQGEDPWEAAKTGAFRGAIGGGMYQYAKAATGAKSRLPGMKGIKDNFKQMGVGARDTYRAHNWNANIDMRESGNISPQLKTVLRQNQRNKMTGGIFGLKTHD